MAKKPKKKTGSAKKRDKTESSRKKVHSITIAHLDGELIYGIDPPQLNPKKAKVKRGDTVQWKSSDGDWTVFFKGATPLVDHNDSPLGSVSAASGATAGGVADQKGRFPYGVILVLNSNGETVIDDPEIIVESEMLLTKRPKK